MSKNCREIIEKVGYLGSTRGVTGCLRNYRKYKLCTSVLGRLRDLQYIFAVIYETRSTTLII